MDCNDISQLSNAVQEAGVWALAWKKTNYNQHRDRGGRFKTMKRVTVYLKKKQDLEELVP